MEQTIAKNDQYTSKVDEKINVTVFLFSGFKTTFITNGYILINSAVIYLSSKTQSNWGRFVPDKTG